jgi:hypothetical protein
LIRIGWATLIMAVVSVDPIASDLAADRLRIRWLVRAYENAVLGVYSISAKLRRFLRASKLPRQTSYFPLNLLRRALLDA